MRRIEAIATAKGVDPGQLADQLRLCFRVPRLAAPGAGGELAAIHAELAAHPAALVVLDPLYLAAAGASGSNLYDMGAVLQAIQGVCQHAGCALLVVTHWNKTGDGRGADRISGPAGTCRRSSSWGTASPRPGIRSSLAPSRPPSVSWKRPAWPPEARKAMAGPATGHLPPQSGCRQRR
jgi:hypothetical protein